MSNDDLLAAIEADSKSNQPVVDLNVLRNGAKALRDLHLLKADLEDQVKQVENRITKIERDELPELFRKAKLSSLTVEADGNHPAFVAERNTVYSASIPQDKRLDAFQWFESQGHGDLIKSVITIQFGMQEHEKRLATMKLLDNHGVEYYTNESIHHMTLKAFVRHEVKAGHIIPHDLLGVYIYDEIQIKPGT
jgi:hypothetical protein